MALDVASFDGEQFVVTERVLGVRTVSIAWVTVAGFLLTGFLLTGFLLIRRLIARLLIAGLLIAGLTPGRHIPARSLPHLTASGGQYLLERDIPAPRHHEPVRKAAPGWHSLAARPWARTFIAGLRRHRGSPPRRVSPSTLAIDHAIGYTNILSN